MSDTRERFLKAIERLGTTEAERARKLGFTVRTLDNWYAGKGLKTLERLIDAGVVQVAEHQDHHPADIAK
jgi:lambda repressor-like predicted transcriptional regulator